MVKVKKEMTRSDTSEKSQKSNTQLKNERALIYQRYLRSKQFKEVREIVRARQNNRCPELNKAVGGVNTSGHMYGFCADLQVKGDLRKFSNFVIEWMKEHQMKWDQIIWEKCGNVTWLHFCWIGKDGKQRMKIFDIVK